MEREDREWSGSRAGGHKPVSQMPTAAAIIAHRSQNNTLDSLKLRAHASVKLIPETKASNDVSWLKDNFFLHKKAGEAEICATKQQKTPTVHVWNSAGFAKGNSPLHN